MKNAIFDLDGTLLDSMIYWRSLCVEILTARGVKNIPEELKIKARYMYTHKAVEFLLAELGITLDINVTQEEINSCLRPHYVSDAQPKHCAKQFLEKLKKEGCGICLATATDRETFMPALVRLDMVKYFDSIITTSEVGKSKNYPDIFDKALALLGGTKDDTVIFEDALYSIKTATANGFRVFGVEDEYEKTNRIEVIALCDKYITDYGELLTQPL